MSYALLNQTVSSLSAQYEVVQNNRPIYQIKVPLNLYGYRAEIYRDNRLQYTVAWDVKENLRGLAPAKRELSIMSIYDSLNTLRGRVYRRRNKLWGGYYYFVLEWSGVEYQMYEIGLGKQGIKLPVYHNGAQIALIEKGTVVYDNKDSYPMTFQNDDGLLKSIFLTLYYDLVRFANRGEVVSNTKKTYFYYSTNKELKQKYDPNWRP